MLGRPLCCECHSPPSPLLCLSVGISFHVVWHHLVFYLSTWCCFLLLETWKSVRIVGSSYSVFSFLCPSSHFLPHLPSHPHLLFCAFLFSPFLSFPASASAFSPFLSLFFVDASLSAFLSSFRLYSLTQFSRQRRKSPCCCLLDSRKETMMKWCAADRTSEMVLLFRLSLPFSLPSLALPFASRRQQLSVMR